MYRRAKNKVKIRTLHLRSLQAGVIVGLLLAQIFYCNLIQRCGDVELNPGPPKADQLRQTRLSNKGDGVGGRRDSVGRDARDKEVEGAVASELTLKDVMEKLVAMDSNINQKLTDMDTGMDKKLNGLREQMDAAYASVKEEVRGLREEVTDLKRENEDLKSKLDDLVTKTDDLECRSRRNNLLFHGLPKVPNETSKDCEETVREFLTDTLELSEDVTFDRVHRTSNRPNAPIIARCTFYKDRVTILKAKGKLKGTNIFIGEDFSSRVREIRKKLTPHLKAAKSAGKVATMIFDHLLIDGKKFVLGADNSLQEVVYRHVEK